MKLTILCYDKCSTCKKALNWLDEKGISYEKDPLRNRIPQRRNWPSGIRKAAFP